MLLCPVAFAAPQPKTLTVTCDAPTTRENGALLPASEIDVYRFVLVKGSTVLSAVNESTCNWTFPDILPGIYAVTVTVYDTDGERSEAAVVAFQVKKGKLSKVGNAGVTVEVTE